MPLFNAAPYTAFLHVSDFLYEDITVSYQRRAEVV